MSEPERLLYRSNLLGSDKRITNYGGGNTSAKVMETDPLTGEPVEVLWVKGSGGDVGTIKLDGFATLYMDKLRGAEVALSRRRARGRDGRLSAALHLQSQPARRLDRYAAACLRAETPRRPHASRRGDRDRRVEEQPRADRGDFRRRNWLAALEAARLRAGSVAGELLPRNPNAKGVGPRKPWAVHLGRRRPRTATRRRSASSTARSTGSTSRSAGKPAFGGAARQSLPAFGAARDRGAADAGNSRPDLGSERKVGHFDDQPAVLEFVASKDLEAACSARHELPGSFPAHEDPAAGRRLRFRTSPDIDATIAGLACRHRAIPATTTPPITSAASTPTRPPCATRMRWSTWCPASA